MIGHPPLLAAATGAGLTALGTGWAADSPWVALVGGALFLVPACLLAAHAAASGVER